MALLSRLLRRDAPPATSKAGTSAPPSSPLDLSWWGASGFGALSYAMGRAPAENLSVVLACVSAISSAISALPAFVNEKLPDGTKRLAPDHPLQRIIDQPNDLMSWPDLMQFTLGSVLLFGNALLIPEWSNNGQLSELWPLPWWCAQPLLVKGEGGRARLAFDTLQTFTPFGGTGFPRRLFAESVFLLKDRSDTGWLGVSRLQRAGMTLSQALSIQQFAVSMWGNQGVPPLSLEHPGKLSLEAATRVAASWADTHVGTQNARRAVILEEGMKANVLGLSGEDQQVVESRRFTSEELCRCFNVPPPIAGIWENANFASTSAASSWFSQFTLLPWVLAIEREAARTLIADPSRYELVLDLSGLQRGSYSELMATNLAAVARGVLTPNEARTVAGYDPMPGGDKLTVSAAGGRPVEPGSEPAPPRPDLGIRPNGSGRTNGAGA